MSFDLDKEKVRWTLHFQLSWKSNMKVNENIVKLMTEDIWMQDDRKYEKE